MSDFMFDVIVVTIFLVSFFGSWLVIAAETLSDDFEIKGNKGFRKSWFRKVFDGFKAMTQL